MGLEGGSVATVFVDVEGDLTKFKSDVAGAGGVAEKELSASMSRAGRVAGTALAGGAAAALAGGVTAFVDFERGMNEIFTLLPGESQASYDEITEQTKAFAAEVGVMPDQVIGGLYDALGAGVPRDNVFEFLASANEFAKAGAVDLTQSVDALTTGVNAFGLGSDGATRVSDALTKSVLLGKTTVEELSGSLYNVAPVAAAFGITVEDVATGFAVLTAQGTPTAQAATQMKGAIAELGKEGTKASKAFEEMTGQSFTSFIDGGGNMVEAAGLMQAGADEAGVSLIDLFGSIEGGQAFLGLAADMEVSRDFFDQVQNSAGSTEAAFEQMEKGIGPSLDKLKARFALVSIELGTALGPTVEKIGGAVAEFALILSKLPGPVLAAIVGFAGLAGGLLILAGPILKATTLVKGLFTLLTANPYVLIIAATIALGFLIYKNWDEISAFLSATWGAIQAKASEVWNAISGFFSGVLSAISGFFTSYIIAPIEKIIGFFSGLPGQAVAAFEGVKNAVTGVKDTIVGALGEIRSAASNALGPLGDVLGTVGKLSGGIFGSIPGFDSGGVVPGPRGAPRLILAHGGETVLPTHKNPNAGIGGGMVIQGPLIGNATISNDLDIEHVARELDRRLDRARRAQGGLGR